MMVKKASVNRKLVENSGTFFVSLPIKWIRRIIKTHKMNKHEVYVNIIEQDESLLLTLRGLE